VSRERKNSPKRRRYRQKPRSLSCTRHLPVCHAKDAKADETKTVESQGIADSRRHLDRAHYCIPSHPKHSPCPTKDYWQDVTSGPNFSPRRLHATFVLSALCCAVLASHLPSYTSIPHSDHPSENTAKMGFDKTDTLAINTIRTLAVRLLGLPQWRGSHCCSAVLLRTAQHKSSSITSTTHADTLPRWTPPSSPTLATPVRPWAWPRS
jgi:hypothetical protein